MNFTQFLTGLAHTEKSVNISFSKFVSSNCKMFNFNEASTVAAILAPVSNRKEPFALAINGFESAVICDPFIKDLKAV